MQNISLFIKAIIRLIRYRQFYRLFICHWTWGWALIIRVPRHCRFLTRVCLRCARISVCIIKCYVRKSHQCWVLKGIMILFRHKCRDKRCRPLLPSLGHWWQSGCCRYKFRFHVSTPFPTYFTGRISSALGRSSWKLRKIRMSLWALSCGFLE